MGLSIFQLFKRSNKTKASQADQNTSTSREVATEQLPAVEDIKLYNSYKRNETKSPETIKAEEALNQFRSNPKKLIVDFERDGFMPHAYVNDEYVGLIRRIRRIPGEAIMIETSYLKIDDSVCWYSGMDDTEVSNRIYMRTYKYNSIF